MKQIRLISLIVLVIAFFLVLVCCEDKPTSEIPDDQNGENVNSEPEPKPEPEQEPEDPFIRFTSEEFLAYIDSDTELTYDTNYDGELTWSTEDNDIIWLDEPIATGLELGEATVSISFEVDGTKYEATTKVKVMEKKYKITIEGEVYEAIRNTTYEDFFKELYGRKGHPEKEGYEFVEWYLDSDYLRVCHGYNKITDDITLYPLFEKYVYGIKIDRVYGYRSSVVINGQAVAISPSYNQDFNEVSLSNYDLVAFRYNPTKQGYFVVEVGNKVLYYDGFLLCLKKDSAESKEFLPKLTVGREVWLDSYSINKTTKIFFEHEIDTTVKELDLRDIDSRFVSAYDVTNKVDLGNKNGDSRAYPASTTKIITAMAALKYCPVNTTYKIGAEQDIMWQGSSPSTANLKKGQVWTLSELLYATLLPSGNDAAYAVAGLTINYLYPNNTWTAREQMDKFAELMNEVAKEAGATNSHFMVPDGNSYYKSDGSWDDRLTYHYVTANDMVKIARYAFSFGEIAEVVSTVGAAFSIDGTSYNYTNTNHLLNPAHSAHYQGTVGMKTGTTTPAGQCLVTGVFKDGRFVIVAVMYAGSGGRDSASLAVYKKIFGN